MFSDSHKSSPRDVFLYLLAIITLYMSVGQLIALLFEYVNVIFPDILPSHYSWDHPFYAIRRSVATLIIVFPIYIGLSWFLRKDIIAHSEKREMWVRKWLLNFTLFLAAITVITDLVLLVNGFLEGELKTRFLLKVLIVLVVASGVFAYYFWDLRRETTPASKPSIFLAGFASAVVLTSIIGGFFIIGSPVTQRFRRFDNQRVQDLQKIHTDIIEYFRRTAKLPSSFEDMQKEFGPLMPKDPVTNEAYKYRIIGPLNFELCAHFQVDPLPYQGAREGYYGPYVRPPYLPYENWDYKAGPTCFSRKVEPPVNIQQFPLTVPVQKRD